MNPVDNSMPSDDYRRVEKAIGFIEANVNARPTLDQIAAHVILADFISTGCSSAGRASARCSFCNT